MDAGAQYRDLGLRWPSHTIVSGQVASYDCIPPGQLELQVDGHDCHGNSGVGGEYMH